MQILQTTELASPKSLSPNSRVSCLLAAQGIALARIGIDEGSVTSVRVKVQGFGVWGSGFKA